MRPIRAGKIHVPLAAIRGEEKVITAKIGLALSCWEMQLAFCNSTDPVCPFHLLFPMVFNGM